MLAGVLPRATQIRLTLYDAQGREAAELAKGEYSAGRYQVDWDGRSDRGAVLPGVYFVELVTPGKRVVTRVAIVH